MEKIIQLKELLEDLGYKTKLLENEKCMIYEGKIENKTTYSIYEYIMLYAFFEDETDDEEEYREFMFSPETHKAIEYVRQGKYIKTISKNDKVIIV